MKFNYLTSVWVGVVSCCCLGKYPPEALVPKMWPHDATGRCWDLEEPQLLNALLTGLWDFTLHTHTCHVWPSVIGSEAGSLSKFLKFILLEFLLPELYLTLAYLAFQN